MQKRVVATQLPSLQHPFRRLLSREETGNFLELTLETVSRLLSRFAREGLIRVNRRDVPGLRQLLGQEHR